MLRRRHVFADTIEDIGKESDGWEEDEARTEDQDTVLVYPSSSFDRERMIERIKSVGKRELKQEARIAMRTINAVWAGGDVADDDLKRMADAAERIAQRRKDSDKEAAAAVSLVEDEARGNQAYGAGRDAERRCANLQKVFGGKRNVPASIMQKFRARPVNNEMER